MANISGGSNTANKANVDTNYNLNVTTPQTEVQAGFVQISSEVDAGNVLGTRTVRAAEVSHDYRVRVGSDSPLFNMSFEGTNIAQAHIQQATATHTIAQSGGYLVLNSGTSTAVGSSSVRTYRTFPLLGSYPTYCDMWVRETNATATNFISEWGFGYAAASAAPTDGIFFRRISSGQLQAVISFGGTETSTVITTTNVPARDGTGVYDPAETSHYLISNHNDDVEFWINDILVARISTPAGQGGPTSSSLQPVFGRVYTTTVGSLGRRLEIGFLQVAGGDIYNNKNWAHQMAGSGGGAYQTQPGNASGQTATFAVGAAPGAAAWTANIAPVTNSLGGLWTSPAALPAASEADYPIFAYQNPVGTNALPGKTLYVTGIYINPTIVTTALGATANVLIWGAGVGSTASSLATADSATAVGPRRIVVGVQNFAASAAVGTVSGAASIDLSEAPLVCPAGTFMHITVRVITGVNAGALRGSVTVTGYFE
jgi:hypothetical protein